MDLRLYFITPSALTYFPLYKMAVISQTAFSNAPLRMKSSEFWDAFHKFIPNGSIDNKL